MEPSWHQNRIQKRSYVKIARKQKHNIFSLEFNDFSRFGDRFSEGKSDKNRIENVIQDGMPQFKSLLLRKSSPRRPQDAPRRLLGAPRGLQDALRHPKMRPRCFQEAHKTPPRGLQGTPKNFKTVPRGPRSLQFRFFSPRAHGVPPLPLDFYPTGPWGTPPPASILDGFLFHFEGSGE